MVNDSPSDIPCYETGGHQKRIEYKQNENWLGAYSPPFPISLPLRLLAPWTLKCLEIWLDWVAFQLGSYSRVLMPAQAEGVPPAPSWLVSFSSLVSPWNIPLDLKPLVSLLESRRALWLPGCGAGQPKWRLISLPLQNDILGLPMKGERHISSWYLEMNSG